MLDDILKSSEFKKYFSNTSWMMAEKVIRMGVNFFIGIAIARTLGPEGYGLLSYALSFVALFSILTALGLEEIIVRNLVQETSGEEEILGTAFGLKLCGSFLLVIIAPAASYIISPDRGTTLLVFILAVGHFFVTTSVIEFFFRSRVQVRYATVALLTSFFVASIVKIMLILAGAPVSAFAAAYTLEYVVLAGALVAVYEWRGFHCRNWKFRFSEMIHMLTDAWPLMLSGLFIIGYTRIDQVMIKSILGSEALGKYAVAVVLVEAWYVIPFVITASLFPAIISARFRNDGSYYKRLQDLYSLLFWVSLFIALTVTMIAGPLTRFLFGQAYEGTGAVLSILIWNCVFVFFNFINEKWIIAENIQWMWLFVAPAGFLLNWVLNYFFIRKMGIQGAAVASLLTFFFVSHLAFLTTEKTSRICFMQWKALAMPFLGLKGLFGRIS